MNISICGFIKPSATAFFLSVSQRRPEKNYQKNPLPPRAENAHRYWISDNRSVFSGLGISYWALGFGVAHSRSAPLIADHARLHRLLSGQATNCLAATGIGDNDAARK
jgi:hypothetical protein